MEGRESILSKGSGNFIEDCIIPEWVKKPTYF